MLVIARPLAHDRNAAVGFIQQVVTLEGKTLQAQTLNPDIPWRIRRLYEFLRAPQQVRGARTRLYIDA
jgi:hypothetical protein